MSQAPPFLLPNDYYNPLRLSEKISDTRFSWAHALWLPKWGIHAYPSLSVRKNIELVAIKLEHICNHFQKNAFINSWYRPENYNDWKPPYGVSGAQNSSHTDGMAVDFFLEGMSCDKVREALEPKLEEMKIRCENLPGSAWIHVDVRDVGWGGRFFKP